MASIREHGRFQLEATKLGRTVVFQVTVYERKERNKRRLYAETQCYDPLQYMIQFIIRDATDMDGVIAAFKAQLEHRGFAPLCYRLKNDNGTWAEWEAIEAA
ncbi:MAG: hypothetical protein ACQEXJ_16870 [Myxococcota bacterium]